MKKFKIGISGVGKMGLLHKKTYEEMDNVEIVSLYDPNKQFDSLDKFMDSLKHLDGVSICSPNKYHKNKFYKTFYIILDFLKY